MPRELYARSTTYGPDDEYTLEVTGGWGHVYTVLDEDDPELSDTRLDYLVLRPDQAEAYAEMLLKAAKAVREERKARLEAAE